MFRALLQNSRRPRSQRRASQSGSQALMEECKKNESMLPENASRNVSSTHVHDEPVQAADSESFDFSICSPIPECDQTLCCDKFASDTAEMGEFAAHQHISQNPLGQPPAPPDVKINTTRHGNQKLACFGYSLDEQALRTWHYPTNKPRRVYQWEIVREALARNTLVVLPTGLGKTLIAAVVMHNWHQWAPDGILLFLAPTRPLVRQQMDAIMRTAEISPDTAVEMTGTQPPAAREALWHSKRVFFLTPQVLQNDLGSGVVDARRIALIVFDEAHRAVSGHAYCEVMALIRAALGEDGMGGVRILALTATPASSADGVQPVITNLCISAVAVRDEDSPDVAPYVHGRAIETCVVHESPDIKCVRLRFEQTVLLPYIGRLLAVRAIPEALAADPARLSRFALMRARDTFRAQRGGQSRSSGVAEGAYAALISLYQGYELLVLHGLAPFRAYFSGSAPVGDTSEAAGSAVRMRLQRELDASPDFAALMAHVDALAATPGFVSHPKLEILEKVLLEHFGVVPRTAPVALRQMRLPFGGRPQPSGPVDVSQTRVIVFSHYRESVAVIAACLSRHAPALRVMSFVGQSANITQKQQIEVLARFRDGGYNVLVATCIGEEGLDIGSVDLIVCYDMQSSPVRMLQRVGRTGRHRDGRIVLLLSAGREERNYAQTRAQHKAVTRALTGAGGRAPLVLYSTRPGRVPQRVYAEMQCIERSFDTSAAAAVLDRQAAADSAGRTRRPQVLTLHCSVPGAVLARARPPVLGKSLSAQRTLGPAFLVTHSERTRLLAVLFAQHYLPGNTPNAAESLVNNDALPGCAAASDAAAYLYAAAARLMPMRDPLYVPLPWSTVCEAYSTLSAALYRPKGISVDVSVDTDFTNTNHACGQSLTMANISATNATMRSSSKTDNEDLDEALPDDIVADIFTDCSHSNRASIGKPCTSFNNTKAVLISDFQSSAQNAKVCHNTLSMAFCHSCAPSIHASHETKDAANDLHHSPMENVTGCNIDAAVHSSNGVDIHIFQSVAQNGLNQGSFVIPNTHTGTSGLQNMLHSNATSRHAFDDSATQLPRPPAYRCAAAVAASSSLVSSPAPAKRQRLVRSKYVDTEADASSGSMEDHSGSDSDTSLDGFINDDSELTQFGRSGISESSVCNGSLSDAPSHDRMMALYRRTAFQTQPDPSVFSTAPRKFAVKPNFHRPRRRPSESESSDSAKPLTSVTAPLCVAEPLSTEALIFSDTLPADLHISESDFA